MTVWFASNLVLIQTTLIYMVLALSFHVVLRSGVFSFASVGFYGLGAYGTAIMTLNGVPPLLAFLFVLIGTGIVGTGLAFLVRRLRGLYLGLFSIAFDLVLVVLYRNGGTLTGGPVGLFGVPEIMPLWGMFLVTAVVIVVVARLSRSGIGRSFEALRLNESVARSMGIEVARRRTIAFVLSALLGAVAGVMNVNAFTTVAPSSAGFQLVTLGLTMVVLGGIASWQGALIGAIVVAWLPLVLGPLQQYQIIINGVIIMAFVVLLPDGVAGGFSRLWHRLRVRGRGERPTGPSGSQPTDAGREPLTSRTEAR